MTDEEREALARWEDAGMRPMGAEEQAIRQRLQNDRAQNVGMSRVSYPGAQNAYNARYREMFDAMPVAVFPKPPTLWQRIKRFFRAKAP